MPNVMTNPSNFPRRINNYVSAMMYSADVNYNGNTRVSFGAPLAANPTLVANGLNLTPTGNLDLTSALPFPETYGRTVTYVASAANGNTVSLVGFDYLGQPVREDIVLNGATPVAGKKAFKSFNYLINGTSSATTINIGSGTGLGLPYKALRTSWEIVNGAAAVGSGTLTAAVLTDPQTGTTGDPRGTYVPNSTMNGSQIISAVFDFANDVNTSNNGGLHGIRHYMA